MSYTNGLDKPSDYFSTKLYTGDGSSSHAVSGIGFQPDWVWIKQRDIAENHMIYDSVRGATKDIRSDGTYAENTNAQSLQSFNSDGFTLGNLDNVNKSSGTFASWNWKAGGTASSNTDGSITSSVSASTTAGFSIVSWTGSGSSATIGHGLSATPKMIIAKNRSDGGQFWAVYHASLSGANKYLVLDQNVSAQSGTAIWNSTHPTSSVFSVAGHGTTNESGDNIIAYCFAEKKGFSKFGSYTGNGNADGTFVYTGFRPAWVMVKKTNATHNWTILDTKRNPINDAELALEANLNNAEGSGNNMDILSNGFKFRATGEWGNGSGGSYIYMCFAESPFVT